MGHWGAHDEGVDSLGAVNHEDQGCCTSGEEVFGVDRRKHPLVFVNLPADVDLQGRIRRERTHNRPPQVLLKPLASTMAMLYGWMIPPRFDSSKVHGAVCAHPSDSVGSG